MLKRKLATTVAAFALVAGVGVTTAFADNSPTPTPAGSTISPGEQQNGQEGVDEQGAANDVAGAATDVQQEADNQGPDDQSGDQQGPNDQSGEQGDSGQSGD